LSLRKRRIFYHCRCSNCTASETSLKDSWFSKGNVSGGGDINGSKFVEINEKTGLIKWVKAGVR
jgi:hypothetical protein